MTGRVRAQFIDSAAGRIFTLLHEPGRPVAGRPCVLFIPPFAEEMNKCRRQIAETAAILESRGISSLIVDLYGTGDSHGEFAEASWTVWVHDIGVALSWAKSVGLAVRSLVAVRLGCILAAASLRSSGQSVDTCVFWQPIVSGAQMMNQFLRLRTASSMLESAGAESLDGLDSQLESGQAIEIAGYELSPELWSGVRNCSLTDTLSSALGTLLILEVGRARDDGMSVAGKRLLAHAKGLGITVTGARIPGAPFWLSTEIVVNKALQETTVRHIADSL